MQTAALALTQINDTLKAGLNAALAAIETRDSVTLQAVDDSAFIPAQVDPDDFEDLPPAPLVFVFINATENLGDQYGRQFSGAHDAVVRVFLTTEDERDSIALQANLYRYVDAVLDVLLAGTWHQELLYTARYRVLWGPVQQDDHGLRIVADVIFGLKQNT